MLKPAVFETDILNFEFYYRYGRNNFRAKGGKYLPGKGADIGECKYLRAEG